MPTCHGDLGEGEDDGGGPGLHHGDVVGGHRGQAVQQHHARLGGGDYKMNLKLIQCVRQCFQGQNSLNLGNLLWVPTLTSIILAICPLSTDLLIFCIWNEF